MTPNKDKFSGCLIVSVWEMQSDLSSRVIVRAGKRYIEDYVKTDKVGEFGHFLCTFWTVLDYSQFARELMQSYAKCGKFYSVDYAERIAMTFVEKRIIAFGYSTKEAVKRLCQGISWEESGTPPPAAGNGSAMRAAPIGLFFYDNPEMLIQAAHDQGRITDKDPEAPQGRWRSAAQWHW